MNERPGTTRITLAGENPIETAPAWAIARLKNHTREDPARLFNMAHWLAAFPDACALARAITLMGFVRAYPGSLSPALQPVRIIDAEVGTSSDQVS